MKDVEKYSGEVSINELISYLIKDVYPNFPEFVNLLGGIEKCEKLLYENIKSIERIPKKCESGELARYNIVSKSILVFSEDKFDIDFIKKNKKVQHILVHESIHAVLNRTKGRKHKETGCSSKCTANKRKVNNSMRNRISFGKEKNFIMGIYTYIKFMRAIDDKAIGDALNEGLTVWITEKMLGGRYEGPVYPLERGFIQTINDLKGVKETLKIAKGNINEIADALNMNEEQCIFFMKSFDIATYALRELNECEVYSNIDEKTEKLIRYYEVFFGGVQRDFIDCFVIPEIKRKVDNEGLTKENLCLICKISGRFRAFNEWSKFEGHVEHPDSEESFNVFESYKVRKFAEFSNNTDVNNLQDKDIIYIKSLFDYIMEFNSEELKEIFNQDFYKKLCSRALRIRREMEARQAVIYGESISMEELAKRILKSHKITSSEVKENRATRRAMKRKKQKQHRKEMKTKKSDSSIAK